MENMWTADPVAGYGVSAPAISSVLLELRATRHRLGQSSARLTDGETVIELAALAEEIDRACRRVSMLDDTDEIERLLGIATRRLQALQKLIGMH